MQFKSITTEGQLRQYCRELVECQSIAFDTEFVSEYTYRPLLCLIQVAADGELAVIDAMAVDDLTPFWEAIAAEGHETIVHAGRVEIEFCLEAIGRCPSRLFDVQLAAGFAGLEYPAAYSTLIEKLLGEKLQKYETRTDWRRRPLSQRQIHYALDDVRYLHAIHDVVYARLVPSGRLKWFNEETAARECEIERARSRDRWQRVSGITGLSGKTLAIVRELFHWREAEAKRRDKPVRRVLRDDLIVELARRGTADVKRIRAVRGLERGDLRRRLDDIAACIQRALDLPETEYPTVVRRARSEKLSVLAQFLFTALGSKCRQSQLAPSLVGGPNDIRELLAYRTARHDAGDRTPKLAEGWRAEFVGRSFDELLAGKMAIRIADPASDCPLVFEAWGTKEECEGETR